jgi:hypothetical protein
MKPVPPRIKSLSLGAACWLALLCDKAAVSALTDEQVKNGIIKRGFDVRPNIQLDIYKEALLIFYGKASIYLRALGKPLPERWPAWIG